ncbi:hypothetical protein LP419_17600 [Massilia sp. H-1]|nr:hypothetical protein LP419_17600 [Massilia sp. H-1]
MRFLLIALALAVASLTAVQFFSSRMGAAMQRDAHQLLAADLRIAAEAPIDARWRAQAATLGLRSAATVELNSMALAGEGDAARSRMVALKAVEGGYPLRGTLSLHGGAAMRHGPARRQRLGRPGPAGARRPGRRFCRSGSASCA